jgi:hypothetical protein
VQRWTRASHEHFLGEAEFKPNTTIEEFGWMLRAIDVLGGRSVVWVVLLALAGCGNSAEQELLDQARSSVEKGLETWKRGQQADSLMAAPESIEFFDDDWIKGARLSNFRLVRTFIDTDGLAKCAVELTVQVGSDSATSQAVTYQVVKKPHIVISRDPFN